jgi:hypothetical protein
VRRVALASSGAAVALAVALHAPVLADDVETLLERAVDASREVGHDGWVTVVSFGERGPQVAELHVRRDADGVRIERVRGGQLVSAAADGQLRAADRLLRVAGLGSAPDLLDRLRRKYAAARLALVDLDTGPAVPVELVERDSGVRREVLYLDEVTGLVVRRETFDRGGAPVRVVAYTRLEPLPAATLVASDDAASATGPRYPDTPPELLERLGTAGFVVHDELGAGYRLLGAVELADASVPTVHLLYGDGLYTLSVFQQQGRMASAARRGAVALATEDGGAVWRWPGSEPRRLVWNGDGLTFTVLADAPTDEVLLAIGGLPTDPPSSILDRLSRGLQRVGRWFTGDVAST